MSKSHSEFTLKFESADNSLLWVVVMNKKRANSQRSEQIFIKSEQSFIRSEKTLITKKISGLSCFFPPSPADKIIIPPLTDMLS